MPDRKRLDYSDESELKVLRKLGEEAFGLPFDKFTKSGSEANLIGLKTEHITLSRRLDSRTYFAYDNTFGTGRDARMFRGTDKLYFRVCRSILKHLKIPLSEVARQVFLKEQTQVANYDSESGKVVKEAVEDGKYFARLTRQVDGVPVWSSILVVGLAGDQRVGYLQLHWPEIPSILLLEAHCLAHKVANQWKPPEQPGASVESVEAGIVHSPAIGFFLDIYAAIRVIYRPAAASHMQKPVHYFDRHGKSIPVPRQIEHPAPELRERKQDQQSKVY